MFEGVAELLQASVLLPWLLGMVFGIFVGATPGLTATMAVALILPLSFKMEPAAGLAMIIGVSFTAIFAGDIPATFLRIPGTPASAAATLDGFAMAQKGRGQLALSLDLWCSAIGGLIGVVLLILVAPQLARWGLRFGSQERFWLAMLGLGISALACQGNLTKGLLSAAVGLAFSCIGYDVVSGAPRYSFGIQNLNRPANEFVIPIMIGLFGVSEALRSVRHLAGSRSLDPLIAAAGASNVSLPPAESVSLWTVFAILARNWWTVLQSSFLGAFIGALPGAGADIAAWGAYGLAKKTAHDSKDFGKGTESGVIAPTSANNAAVAGAWIPALVFGVPGDSVTAIVLGALLMYDIKPGPNIFTDSATQVHQLFLIAIITQFLLLPAGYAGIKAFAWIMKLPRSTILAAVLVFSVVGSYAINNSLFDVWVMFVFGVVGWFLESQKVPLAPLILGVILGPMLEENLRAGLIGSDGQWTSFLFRPISAALATIIASSLIVGLVRAAVQSAKRRERRRSAA